MSFELQPELEGETLRLRPLAEADREALYAVASDPALWALHPAHDRHERPVFDKLFDESIASGGALTVIDKASGAIIGSSRYSFTYAEPGEVEIGWTFLARTHWGGATNRELKRLMLAHAFRFVDRVIFRVGEHNLRSRRALEKIGARLTTRSQTAMMAGKEVRHLVYALERAEFEASAFWAD
jgi:RimJ/RimL family protein N-acetyltransferase